MSERTGPSLAKADALLAHLRGSSGDEAALIEETEALRRAIAAFHMEAIRFRMYSVDRLIRLAGEEPERRRCFDELRHELEAAGFHTRSHSAP
jgi:hypothetical protein